MTVDHVLQPGDAVPHFKVRCLDGSVCDYSATAWQRRNLLLVALPAHSDVDDVRYIDELLKHAAAFEHHETLPVFTREAISGLPAPGVLVADRWGEIYFATSVGSVNKLPRAPVVLEWVRYVDHECPECQGEAR